MNTEAKAYADDIFAAGIAIGRSQLLCEQIDRECGCGSVKDPKEKYCKACKKVYANRTTKRIRVKLPF